MFRLICTFVQIKFMGLQERKGRQFFFNGKPYMFHYEVMVKIDKDWLKGIEYEALYDLKAGDKEFDVKYGDRFVRLQQESKEIIEAIKNSTL